MLAFIKSHIKQILTVVATIAVLVVRHYKPDLSDELGIVVLVLGGYGIQLPPMTLKKRPPVPTAALFCLMLIGCTPAVLGAEGKLAIDTSSCIVRQLQSGVTEVDAVLGACAGASLPDVVALIDALLVNHPGADPDAGTRAKAQYAELHHMRAKARAAMHGEGGC